MQTKAYRGPVDVTGHHAEIILAALREKPNGVAPSTLAKLLGRGAEGQRRLAFALDRFRGSDHQLRLICNGQRQKYVLEHDAGVGLHRPEYGRRPDRRWTPDGWVDA